MEYVDYFPGHDFVDVLAADIYRGDYRQSHHDQLVELANEKPIAMGEIGLVPGPQILDQQPQWAWFMIWARFPWTKNNKDDVRNLYNHPRVLINKDIVFDDN
jgi:mannan endo-1,4-beta-mannosidase